MTADALRALADWCKRMADNYVNDEGERDEVIPNLPTPRYAKFLKAEQLARTVADLQEPARKALAQLDEAYSKDGSVWSYDILESGAQSLAAIVELIVEEQ